MQSWLRRLLAKLHSTEHRFRRILLSIGFGWNFLWKLLNFFSLLLNFFNFSAFNRQDYIFVDILGISNLFSSATAEKSERTKDNYFIWAAFGIFLESSFCNSIKPPRSKTKLAIIKTKVQIEEATYICSLISGTYECYLYWY